MPRSFSNPRVVLSALFGVGFFGSVIWTYVERPRLQPGFGGIGGSIPIRQSEVKNADLRTVRFRTELENRLSSAEFMRAMRARDSHDPPFFQEGTQILVRQLPRPALDAKPYLDAIQEAILDAYNKQALVFTVGVCEESDLFVMYLFPQAYRVEKSANSWILWLQARLPGMPDTERLTAEADAANQAIKADIEKQIQLAVQEIAVPHGR